MVPPAKPDTRTVIRVRVAYYHWAREAAGCESEELDIVKGTTAGGLLALAIAKHPAMAAFAKVIRVAVDNAYVPASTRIETPCEIALLPPVSGG